MRMPTTTLKKEATTTTTTPKPSTNFVCAHGCGTAAGASFEIDAGGPVRNPTASEEDSRYVMTNARSQECIEASIKFF